MATKQKKAQRKPTPFETIRDQCWRGGRPLVPLFGAGLSADAGVLTTQPLEEYLHRLWCYLQIHLVEKKTAAPTGRSASLKDRQPDSGGGSRADGLELIREYLTQNGWLDRSVLNAEWANSAELRLYWERGKGRLELDKWWKWLDRLTNSDRELMEGLFNRIVRNALPNTAHQYAAFLAKLMDWRLILTTNFDTLIEAALREEQLRFTVFELPESGPLPEPGLIRP